MDIDQSSRVPLSPVSLSITVRVQVPAVDSASKSEGVKLADMLAPVPVWSRSVISVPSGDSSFIVSWDLSGWVMLTATDMESTVSSSDIVMVSDTSPGVVVVEPAAPMDRDQSSRVRYPGVVVYYGEGPCASVDSASKSEGVRFADMLAPVPVWSRRVTSVPSGDSSFIVSWICQDG